jgi:long-chain acyl-CoA synthetase
MGQDDLQHVARRQTYSDLGGGVLSRDKHSQDKVALVCGEDVWTRGRLFMAVERLTRGFAASGIGAGDRIVLHLRNRPEFILAYLACFRSGAIAVPINPRLKLAEVKPILKRVEPAMYIGQNELYDQVDRLACSTPGLDDCVLVDDPSPTNGCRSWLDLLSDARTPASTPVLGETTPALLLPTSGTTGLPKLAVHTRGTLGQVLHWAASGRSDKNTFTICATPLAHAMNCLVSLSTIDYGEAVNLISGFEPAAILDEIERGRGHRLMLLPHMFDALADEQRARPKNVEALQICVSGGDGLPLQSQRKFEESFGVKLLTTLGFTEASASFIPGANTFRLRPGVEAKFLDSDGRETTSRDGGVLAVRGPNTVVGYWESPSFIAPLSENGWFHTGDIVKEASPGELMYVSRAKDIIIRAGSNISPMEVEQALLKHAAVYAAAVIGIPDQVLGERVAGFIQLAKGAVKPNLRSLIADLSDSIANYKLPEMLKIVDNFPRNGVGKINRAELRTTAPTTAWDLDVRPAPTSNISALRNPPSV